MWMIGGGGHARSVSAILQEQQIFLKGLIAPEMSTVWGNIEWNSDEDQFLNQTEKGQAVMGIGHLPIRYKIWTKWIDKGWIFPVLISKYAILDKGIHLDNGVQVLPGAIIRLDSKVGSNTIINSGAIIEHGCSIGRHGHIAPGAVLCGDVTAEDHVLVGAGAVVMPGVCLGNHSKIGAGAVVTKNVPANTSVKGVFKG